MAMAAIVNTSVLLQTPVFSQTTLAPELKEALIGWLWPQSGNQPHPHSVGDFDAYFTYFQQQCGQGFREQHAMQSFSDLVLILDTIRNSPSASLVDIRSLVGDAKTALATDERKLSASIELAVRLWLMVNVRILMPTHRHDLEISIPWPDSQSLLDILRLHISQPSDPSLSTTDNFSTYFNTVDMRNIVNFRVLWTSNLAEHLSVRGPHIYIFHQVSALKSLRCSVESLEFLPVDLIDETLATLSLLMPHSMPTCNSWLRSEIVDAGLDHNIMYRETANRDKRGYPYWQERLCAMYETFERTKPSSPMQWWYDRRDMGQWWGFWLVVTGIFLTVIFGLIQSVTGILQVVKSG
ncbi:hypothetical protein GQ53DRAFT_844510 [Thozetella sp. PMI_491]|nr:hypothetical protein GQ53DRAFT_844510 [Thozetella sp. PMI_491]